MSKVLVMFRNFVGRLDRSDNDSISSNQRMAGNAIKCISAIARSNNTISRTFEDWLWEYRPAWWSNWSDLAWLLPTKRAITTKYASYSPAWFGTVHRISIKLANRWHGLVFRQQTLVSAMGLQFLGMFAFAMRTESIEFIAKNRENLPSTAK